MEKQSEEEKVLKTMKKWSNWLTLGSHLCGLTGGIIRQML